MSKAAKRERQRLNREARREAEIAAARRRRTLKTARNVGLLLLPLVGLFVFLQITRDDEAAAIECDDVEAPAPRPVEPGAAPANELVPTTLYTAVLDTSCGKITILLDTAQGPTVVNNFVFLARQGFYDNTSFHRAAKDFVIQGGDPAGDGSGGPGYELVGEVPATGGAGYSVGSVAMAKSGDAAAGTTGSQFFIITSEGEGLTTLNTEPYQYGILGQVSKGLKIAQKIESFAPSEQQGGDGPPTKTVLLKKVTIKETPATPETAAPTTAAPTTVTVATAPPGS